MYPDSVMHLMLTHDFALMSTLTPLRRLKSFVLSFVRLYASVSDMSRWMKLERPLKAFESEAGMYMIDCKVQIEKIPAIDTGQSRLNAM